MTRSPVASGRRRPRWRGRARPPCSGSPRTRSRGPSRPRCRRRPARARRRRGRRWCGWRCRCRGRRPSRGSRRRRRRGRAGGLQLVDDLHRAHLRGARDGAGREGRAQGVRRAAALGQPPHDGALDVHDVAVAAHVHQVGHPHACRSRTRGPRSLRPRSTSITCSARSLGSASSSVAERGRPPPRSRRAGGCRRSGASRRGRPRPARASRATSPTSVTSPVSRKNMNGRRVDRPQAAVDVERVEGHRRREPLGGDELEDVAGVDVLPGALHRRLELLARHVAGDGAERRFPVAVGGRGTGPERRPLRSARVATVRQ